MEVVAVFGGGKLKSMREMGAEDPNFEGRLEVADSLSEEEEQLDGPQVEISKRGWACQLPRPRDRRRGVLGRWSACSWSVGAGQDEEKEPMHVMYGTLDAGLVSCSVPSKK